MSKPMTNGERFPSQTIDHLNSYPLTKDIVNIYSSNSIGRLSIDITQAIYINLIAPFLPLFHTPYTYVSPYIDQADNLGDSTLNYIDTNFPATKKTGINELKSNAHTAVNLPFQLTYQTRDYVFDVWADEYSKTARENNGRKDIFTTFWALLSTALRVAAETLRATADYIKPKREEAKQRFGQLKQYAANAIGQAEEYGNAKAGQVKEKADQGKRAGSTYLQYGQEQVNGAVGAAAQKVDQGREEVRGAAQLGQEKVDVGFHFASEKAAQAEQRAQGQLGQQGHEYADVLAKEDLLSDTYYHDAQGRLFVNGVHTDASGRTWDHQTAAI